MSVCGIVQVGVDEAGHDQLAAIVVDRRIGRQRGRQLRVIAGGLHAAVIDDQQAVLVPVVGVVR